MSTVEIVLIVLVGLSLLASLICLILILVKKNRVVDENAIIRGIDSQLDAKFLNMQQTSATTLNSNNSAMATMIENYMKVFKDQISIISRTVEGQLDNVRKNNETSTEKTRNELYATVRDMRQELEKQQVAVKQAVDKLGVDVNNNLEKVREDNDKQLTKMRETVDEKLSNTLKQRLETSFGVVTERLQEVSKGLGEMKQLSEQVTSLNKIFSNNKSYGNWGEVSLEGILEQVLSPEQYEKQKRLDKTQNAVDFVIKMPNGEDKDELYLPIDSKFPLAHFEKLVEIQDTATQSEIAAARRDLFAAVKKEAKSISEKYIQPPKTTNFAIMYLPAESLYAEIIRNYDLTAELMSQFRITICGPTTIVALLNSLQAGFTTLKIQKKSVEVSKQLIRFKKDFESFSGMIEKTQGKAKSVVDMLDDVYKKNEKIQKNLSKVEDITGIDSNESIEEVSTVDTLEKGWTQE